LRHALQRAGSCGLGKAGHGPHFHHQLGRIDYEVGYSSAGFDHFSSEIVARWNDGGAQEQTLYEGIYDRPPAKVWGNGPHLCIAMQTCARYSDRCSRYVIAHRYDAQAKAFVELKSEDGAPDLRCGTLKIKEGGRKPP
jgi:hypothetical protein